MRILHHALHLTRITFFLLLLLLAATFTGLRFWLLPRIDGLRHNLETELSHRLNQPVRIHHLHIRLDGFTPRLRLLDVTVGLRRQIRLEEIQLAFDVPASLHHRRLQPAQLRILKAHIELQKTPQGGFRILGLGGSGEGFPPWLLADGSFELLHSTLVWHGISGSRPVTWKDVSIHLDNRDREHFLRLSFRSPHDWAGQVLLSMVFQGDPGQPSLWRGRFLSRFERLHLPPFAAILLGTRIEGKGNLQLWGNWQGQSWEVHGNLDLHDLVWPSARLHQPLRLQQMSGRVHFTKTLDGWRVKTDSFHLSNADFDIRTRLKLDYPHGTPPHLEAFARVAHLNMARLHAYLPHNTPESLSTWLHDTPLRGDLHGLLSWRGRVVDFPFRNQSGISEARLMANHAIIRFHPLWPPVSGAIDLRFRNGVSEISVGGARFGAVPFHALKGRLNFPTPKPLLEVQGHAHTHPHQVMETLKRSPLQSSIQAIGKRLRMAGRADLDLRVSIPLKEVEDYQIQGRAQLREGKLHLRSQPLSLEGLNGLLTFNQQRVHADMKGRFQRQQAHLEIQVTADQTNASVRTRVSSASLAGQASPPWLQGSAEASFHLLIPHDFLSPPILEVQSNLRGLALNLPPPLGKPAPLERLFRLTTWLTVDRAIPISVEYAGMHAALAVDKTTHHISGRIGIHQPPPPPHDPNGLVVAGHMERLALTPWLHWWQTTNSQQEFTALRHLDLIIDHLLLDNRNLGRHQIRATHEDSGWHGKLISPYGDGEWSFAENGFRMDLGSLDLSALRTLLSSTSIPLHSGSGRYPFRLECKNLHWEGNNLGHLDLSMLPHPSGGLRFDLRLQGDTQVLEGSGSWQIETKPTTRLEGRFQSPKLGRFLSRIGHPTALADTPARIDFQLLWPDAPHRISAAKLHGRLSLHLGSGRWLALEPGAGRLLGLLYLGTLERRLHLDFSDLFASGLAYDRISGHIRLAGGHAFTDDLVIEAVAARIFISGTADLVGHQVNESLIVIPNTPLTLGLFGHNRPHRASLVQKLFNTPLDTITQSQYAIYGPWNDPAIVRLHRSIPGALWGGIWSGLKELVHE